MDEQSRTHSGEPLTDEMTETSAKELSAIHTFDQWVAELFVIFSITNQLLKEYYEREENKTEIPEFPIPAEKIAVFCGYEIIQEDLNRYRNKQISLTLGKINTGDRTISIDNGIGVSYAQKRYAVAHELGHAYLQGKLHNNSQLCTEARIPSGRIEFLADIFAAFLMLPPRKTFEYVNQYIQSNLKRPVDHEKMMVELSSTAKYPYTRTITAYEHLRLLASYAYYHKEEIVELLSSMAKKYPQMENPQELLREPIAPKELYS